MSDLNLARVTKLYPEIPAADIIMLDTAWPAPRVPICCDITSTSGRSGLPDMDPLTDERQVSQSIGNVLLAVVGYMKGRPIIIGWLPPAISQMIFTDGRHVHRFPSDVYVSCDKDGNLEVSHPSGTYLRIGESPDHEDLTGRDAAKRWDITKNKTRSPTVRVRVAAAGAVKGTVQLDSTGKLSADVDGDVHVKAGGNIVASADGEVQAAGTKVTVTAQSKIVLDAAIVECTGLLTAQTDVQAGPKKTSLAMHSHGGVTAGQSVTSPPVA